MSIAKRTCPKYFIIEASEKLENGRRSFFKKEPYQKINVTVCVPTVQVLFVSEKYVGFGYVFVIGINAGSNPRVSSDPISRIDV